MYFSVSVLLGGLGLILALVGCSKSTEFNFIDRDTYPMAHANAILAALYHFKPLRNLAFSTELASREEESYDEAMYSLQLVFAKMYLGGTVNAIADLEKTYLASESLESFPSGRFIDPHLFYSWCSHSRLLNPLFSWKLETITEFSDSEHVAQVLQSEVTTFDIDSNSIRNGHNLQNHLDALQVGVETKTAFSAMGHSDSEQTIRRRIQLLALPNILTFRIFPKESSVQPVVLKSSPSPRAHLSISSSLRLGEESFHLYAVVCASGLSDQFQTFIQVEPNVWSLYESDSPAQSVSVDQVLFAASSTGYLLFYGKPEYMNPAEIKIPHVDLELKSLVTQRLYSVSKTLKRSNSNTPSPIPNQELPKNKRQSSDRLAEIAAPNSFTHSPSSRSSAGTNSPFPSKGLPPLPSRNPEMTLPDFSSILIGTELKPVVIETADSGDSCDNDGRREGVACLTGAPSCRADASSSSSPFPAVNSAANMQQPRTGRAVAIKSNYLFGWSGPDFAVEAEPDEEEQYTISDFDRIDGVLDDSALEDRHRQLMEPLRREISQLQLSRSLGASPMRRVRKTLPEPSNENI